MGWKRLPEPCIQCQATLKHAAAKRSRAACASCQRAPDGLGIPFGPHDRLENVGTLNYFDDGSLELYRCRCCESWWEFRYLPDDTFCSPRRLRVTSVEEWRRRARQARNAGLRLLLIVFCGIPSLLLVLSRLYAVAVPSADPAFRGPNPWLGLVLALLILGSILAFYARIGRSS